VAKRRTKPTHRLTGTSKEEIRACAILSLGNSPKYEDFVQGHSARLRGNPPPDFVIEDTKTIYQYDGRYWHKDRAETDLHVAKRHIAAGYRVIRLRDNGLPVLPETPGLECIDVDATKDKGFKIVFDYAKVAYTPSNRKIVEEWTRSRIEGILNQTIPAGRTPGIEWLRGVVGEEKIQRFHLAIPFETDSVLGLYKRLYRLWDKRVFCIVANCFRLDLDESVLTYWSERLVEPDRLGSFICSGVVARLGEPGFDETLTTWLDTLKPDKFATFMCDGVAARLGERGFDETLTTWLDTIQEYKSPRNR
jgi:hypothetical protein